MRTDGTMGSREQVFLLPTLTLSHSLILSSTPSLVLFAPFPSSTQEERKRKRERRKRGRERMKGEEEEEENESSVECERKL